MDLDSVLKKLRKLQKLYDGAKAINSEGEAAAAAAAIQRLLTEYNLTISEVSQSEEEEKKQQQPNHELLSGYTYKSIGGMWEYHLWYVLCKWNFCKCFQYGNSYKRLIIFGNKENLEVVKWMFGVLSERFVEFSVANWKEYRKTAEYQFQIHKCSKDRYQRGYLSGAVSGLDAKLKQISDQDKKAEPEYGTKVTALVLRSNTAIDNYITEKFGGTTKGRRSSAAYAGTASGRAQGYKDGYNTDIHKPIQQNQHKAASGVKLLS